MKWDFLAVTGATTAGFLPVNLLSVYVTYLNIKGVSKMTYINFIEDPRGDLVDLEYFCSTVCASDELVALGGWPTLDDTDSDIYCTECGDLIQRGIYNG